MIGTRPSDTHEIAGAQEHPRYRGAMATTTATPSRSTSSAIASRKWAIDLGLWLVACAPLLGSPFIDDHTFGVPDGAAAVAGLALIVARRRWPIPALAVGLIAVVAATAALGRPTALLPVSVVLLFNVAVRSDRAVTIRAGIAGVAALLSCIAILVSNDFFGPELLAGVAWPTLAAAAGDAVRSRREAIAAAEERAARAEATREQEARRRVVEERLHIARELHDVVAHQIAVINVQAGVAAHLMRAQPDAAESALATVRSSAQQVLDELSGLLGVLRADTDDGATTAPAPTIADLGTLIASFDGTDLRVRLETSGEPRPMSDTASVTIYRVVQEALTNAHKHGCGEAQLRIAHGDDGVEVEVSNAVRPDPDAAPSSGFGLVGMRERIHAVGGTLEAGQRPDGTFRVRALVPAPRPQERS
jgi:signal transduction histidine kinase